MRKRSEAELARLREIRDMEPLAAYRMFFTGVGPSELRRQASTLYDRLSRAGLLSELPRKTRKIGDPVAYYCRYYPGLTRQQLRRRDRPLNDRIVHVGRLAEIPLGPPARGKYRRIPDPLAYYREHYPGMTRTQLATADGALYARLRQRGLLRHVPTRYRRRKAAPRS